LKLKTKGKPIEWGKKFFEDDDWLKGLTVTVQNVSNKAIARIELDLTFPRPPGTAEEIPTYAVPINYGKDPADSGPELLRLLLHGESVDIGLIEANFYLIKTDLERLGYPEKITHAQIRVDSVTFSD